jgi:hypothetical protein
VVSHVDGEQRSGGETGTRLICGRGANCNFWPEEDDHLIARNYASRSRRENDMRGLLASSAAACREGTPEYWLLLAARSAKRRSQELIVCAKQAMGDGIMVSSVVGRVHEASCLTRRARR